MENQLFLGENLEILQKFIQNNSIDLVYIDPPFNSNRNYNSIDTKNQAFSDIWKWNNDSETEFLNILNQPHFSDETKLLIQSFEKFLKKSNLFAYLVSLTLRINEIFRILKPTGSLFLHCNPTASHYLKLILDAIFCCNSGTFRNEIIWGYRTGGISKQWFARKHDIILFYAKTAKPIFHQQNYLSPQKYKYGFGKKHHYELIEKNGQYFKNSVCRDIWDDIDSIGTLGRKNDVRNGYPTQKPENLLERIIKSASNEGETILDAYCGSGTTLIVAAKLNRNFIGIDNSETAIYTSQKRLTDAKIEYKLMK